MECVWYNESEREQEPYEKIYSDYHGVHGYVATVLCCFGLLANLCNVVVLTRAEMFSTINMLLTTIAVCDTALMASYVLYLAHYQLTRFDCLSDEHTLGWALFTVFYADLSVTLRAYSLWLAVVMAALRSHILSRHQVLLLQSRYIANKRLGWKLIGSTALAVTLMSVPVFVNNTVQAVTVGDIQPEQCGRRLWLVGPPSITMQNDCLVLKLGYWTHGLLLKLAPCCLLTYYLLKLIHFVRMHMQHSQSRFGERETVNSLKPTSFLLSAILFVTLLCELPNALASLFGGVKSFRYGVMIYRSLGDIFDLLSLINGITSFLIYCTMSQMFRETFVGILCDVRRYLCGHDGYYRRWSLAFGASHSQAELQRQPLRDAEVRQSFSDEPDVRGVAQADDRRGLLDRRRSTGGGSWPTFDPGHSAAFGNGFTNGGSGSNGGGSDRGSWFLMETTRPPPTATTRVQPVSDSRLDANYY